MFTRYATKAMFLSLGAAAALVNVAVAAPAQAADYDGRSQVVRYGDLDLTSTAGAARLQQRIVRAAHAVCDAPGRQPLAAMAAEQNCRAAAIASAEPQVKLILALGDGATRFADAGALTVSAN